MSHKKAKACNDNSYSRRLFYNRSDEDGSLTRLIKHIPLARTLIKNHSNAAYKHSREHSDYAFLEYELCMILDRPVAHAAQRSFQLYEMALALNVNPTLLVNEPLLSIDATSLARFP